MINKESVKLIIVIAYVRHHLPVVDLYLQCYTNFNLGLQTIVKYDFDRHAVGQI